MCRLFQSLHIGADDPVRAWRKVLSMPVKDHLKLLQGEGLGGQRDYLDHEEGDGAAIIVSFYKVQALLLWILKSFTPIDLIPEFFRRSAVGDFHPHVTLGVSLGFPHGSKPVVFCLDKSFEVFLIRQYSKVCPEWRSLYLLI